MIIESKRKKRAVISESERENDCDHENKREKCYNYGQRELRTKEETAGIGEGYH